MRPRLLFYPVVFLLLFFTVNNYCQKNSSEKLLMKAVKIDKPIELTGKLDNPFWASAEPVELKYEINPGDNTPAAQKTLVYCLYDNKYLYFGFKCFDTNPEQIRANLTDRDKIFQDDYVVVILDTYGDYNKAYEFCVNPFGIKGDLLRSGDDDEEEDESFDLIWEASAARNENGWTAEMAIPFSSLNFSNNDEQTWLLEVLRNLPRESRKQISWVPIDRNIPVLMPQAGLLKGLKNIESGGKLEFLPYIIGQLSGKESNESDPNSSIKYDPVIGRVGMGINYSPNASFNLDAVINPDFSQIESDADQISVNTTFALDYDEKRPFFLVGKELLPNRIFYSRSINDPLYAGRIIGKAGALTYMYMGAYDRNTIFVIPGDDNSSTVASSMKSIANVGRIRYDLGDENYVGGMIFSRNLDGGHNYVLGVDWKYKFWSNWYFSGSGYFSQTKEIQDSTLFNSSRYFGDTEYNAGFNGESYSGSVLQVELNHSDRLYNFELSYSDYSPTFQTYDGLFTLINSRQVSMGHGFVFYPQNSILDKISISMQGALRFNYSGLKKEQFASPNLTLTFKGQTSVNLSYLLVNDENFFGADLKGVNRAQFSISTRPINEIYFYLSGSVGDFIRRSATPTVGKGHSLSVQLQLKPTSKFDITFSYSRSRLDNKETGSIYYDGNIYRGTAIYQFTSQIFFRTILQYNTFSQTFQVYPLFSYKLNAFTTFFAGATSNYHNYGDDYGFQNTDQQYFIKMQYLLGI